MIYLRIIILGIVQGVTEFLPVSSDGHLVVADRLVGLFSRQKLPEGDVLETIILHLGTLLAILVAYWKPILRLLGADRRLIALLLVGTIPAGVVGLALKKYCSDWLTDPLLTGAMLLVNGGILLWINRQPQGEQDYQSLNYRQTLWIGTCQAAAPLPGISRSGTTIAAALAAGLRREDAATFSFLLAVPAISGAVAVALIDLARGEEISSGPGTLALGAAVSFVVGLVSLRLLLRVLNSGRLNWFGWWCIGVGAIVLAWQLAAPTVSQGV